MSGEEQEAHRARHPSPTRPPTAALPATPQTHIEHGLYNTSKYTLVCRPAAFRRSPTVIIYDNNQLSLSNHIILYIIVIHQRPKKKI